MAKAITGTATVKFYGFKDGEGDTFAVAINTDLENDIALETQYGKIAISLSIPQLIACLQEVADAHG